jgi:hypothetical protein
MSGDTTYYGVLVDGDMLTPTIEIDSGPGAAERITKGMAARFPGQGWALAEMDSSGRLRRVCACSGDSCECKTGAEMVEKQRTPGNLGTLVEAIATFMDDVEATRREQGQSGPGRGGAGRHDHDDGLPASPPPSEDERKRVANWNATMTTYTPAVQPRRRRSSDSLYMRMLVGDLSGRR